MYDIEGREIKAIPAEGIVLDALLVEGGERCGIRSVWRVLQVDRQGPTETRMIDELAFIVRGEYLDTKTIVVPADHLMLAVVN